MPFFESDGVKIHYYDEGDGAPVVLVHGFASSAQHNWGITGWYRALSPHYRVLAFDCRGHGASDKPHDTTAYATEAMGDDVIRLLDRLGIERALMMGYSMGARICMWLLGAYPERFRAVVLGGIGARSGVSGSAVRRTIVDALTAPDKSRITDPNARLFRDFAEANHNDLAALAACMSATWADRDEADYAALTVPVMIVVGSKDALVRNPGGLQRVIPGSTLLTIDGRNHLNTPGDRRYKEAVLDFFAQAPP